MTILNMALMLSALCKLILCPDSRSPEYFTQEDSLKIIEKVYLHFDRDSYYPGDEAWFKAYLIDASDRSLSGHSENLHVELISPELRIIDSRIVKMTNGLGKGDFSLSAKLKSGLYHIRAYTNYMRNFGDQLFFYKELTVINPADAVKAFSGKLDIVLNKMDLDFFPEGGSLIDNVPSIVAFKAVNSNGKGCDVSGEIYASSGEIVTTFISTHKGMGAFSLSPSPGRDYYAVVKDHYGNSVKSEIQKSFPRGFVMNVSKNMNSDLLVTVRTNAETLSSLADPDLSVNVSARNIYLKKADFTMKSLANRFILPVGDLPEGIVSLTLCGPDNTPLCERLVYLKNEDNVNINLETDKTIYNQRDSVSLKVTLRVNSLKSQDAFLSLSVSREIAENCFRQFPSSISTWFLLESDIRGIVEEPSYYFDPSNPDRLRDLDLLLLTQGWRDFQWKYKNIYYPAEQGFSVSGRVRNKFADKPIIDSRVFIAIFKNGKPVIKTVPTDSSGKFHVNDLDLAGNANIIVSAVGENERLHGWLLLDSLKYMPPEVGDTPYQSGKGQSNIKPPTYKLSAEQDQNINEYITGYIQYSEIKNSIQKKFKLSDTILPGEVKIVVKRSDMQDSPVSRSRRYLMGSPDKSLKITPEMEKYGTLKQLFWYYPNFASDMGRVIFLIDGVKVSGEMFMSVPPSFIERVDVLNTLASVAIFGANTEDPLNQDKPADGVLSITTRKEGPRISSKFLYHSANIRFSGYDEPRIFYSPKHHSSLEKDYKPDLRTTLFWEPDLKIENNKSVFLNYFNADNPSKVSIMVEGITTAGIPVTGRAEYEVK